MINVNNAEFSTLVFCSFRYALGRSTYIVSDVADIIIKHQGMLSDNIKLLIVNEIKEAIDNNNAGMEMDVLRWKEVITNLTHI